jgi:hypothetical protein
MTTGADKLTDQAVRHIGVRWLAGYFTNRITAFGNGSLCTISTIIDLYFTSSHIKEVPIHYVVDHPQSEDGRNYLTIRRVATNTLCRVAESQR